MKRDSVVLISRAALIFFFLTPAGLLGQQDCFDTIMNRVKQELLKREGELYAVNADLAYQSLLPNGSWADVDYKDRSMVNWKANNHLANLRTLIESYISGAGDEKIYGAITTAFAFWLEQDPQSNNWWHNEIATPQSLGELMILMRYGKQQLPKSMEDSLLQRMKRGDPYKQTGANKTDIALHYFYRGLLTKDSLLLKEATAQLFEPVKQVHFGEGLQYDNSYLQHGPQLQISSYGFVFLTGVLAVANYLRETSYALSASKTKLLANYYRNMYLKTIRGSFIDFNTEGRGISRKDILRKQNERKHLELMALLDSGHQDEYMGAILRTNGTQAAGYMISTDHQHFWCADYTLHLRATYSFNVRVASNRTRRCEAGNGENLLGRYLSDGATTIQRRGPEYFNIMPVWEWDKIPGVTNRDYAMDRKMDRLWGEPGTTTFAGGVTDGRYGATGYALNYDSVSAKKGWFFFDDEIVCLGAGINSNAAENITTTINQCWTNGNVFTSSRKQALATGEVLHTAGKKPKWVFHDSIGYFFPEGGDLSNVNSSQTGSWHTINLNYPGTKVSGDVFKLWLNHGRMPTKGGYAYIVLPGIRNVHAIRKFNASAIKILANTDSVQAIQHKTLNIIQAIYYRPGIIRSSDFAISSNKACILMLVGKNSICVADPTQKEANVTIRVTNLKSKNTTTITIDLPQHETAGSSIAAHFTW